MNNSNLNEKRGVLNFFIIMYQKMIEKIYYRKNRDAILNRSKDYYKNDKKRLKKQARDKYKERIWKKNRCHNMSEKKKQKLKKYQKKLLRSQKKCTKT